MLLPSAATALTATQDTTLSVTVNAVFQLSLDQTFIDFGRMNPGDTKWDIPANSLVATAKTNNENPWYLKIHSVFPLSSGQSQIPLGNFIWYGWTEGNGTWLGTGNDSLTLTTTLAYKSGTGEEINLPNGTVNHFKFKLVLPEKQKSGTYSTIVKFTMTE